MQKRIDELLPLLAEASGRGIVVRADRALAKLEGLSVAEDRSWGQVPDGPMFIEEHGLRLRRRSGRRTKDRLLSRSTRKSGGGGPRCGRGGRVLDLFCYTGGFSLAASRLGGATEVLGIDTSEKAVAMARSAPR